jgi:hypothetical protein
MVFLILMDYEILSNQNPWWKGRERIEDDYDIQKWAAQKHRWVPKLIEKIDFKPFALNFLFGPRQVGKTTLVKLLIRKLLNAHIRPESIFYFKCDELLDFRELRDVMDLYLQLKNKLAIKTSYIFLDEITFPKGWFRTIKSLIDSGCFKHDFLLLTGSTTLLARKETETFPGRRGYGKDYYLYPLSFRDFIKVCSKELYCKLPVLKNWSPTEMKKLIECLPIIDELNKCLQDYLVCGGFPLAVHSFLEKKIVERHVKDIYLSWMKNDITRIGRRVEISREILKVVLTKVPSTLSWESISREIEIKSPKTISAYIHLLEALFVLKILYHLDLHKETINFGKNKKIHFMDPLFYYLFSEWGLINIKDIEPIIAESLPTSHLSRVTDNIFYWKNKFEIDLVINDPKLTGFETKWRKKVEANLRVIGKLKQVYILSEDTFDEKHRIYPLSAFLACLEV